MFKKRDMAPDAKLTGLDYFNVINLKAEDIYSEMD